MNAGLAWLAFRRALPPGFLLAALAVGALVVAATWEPDPRLVAALEATQVEGLGPSALARQDVWTTLLVVLAPFLVARAAGVVPRWRRGEVDWLAASAHGRARVVLSTWLGLDAAAIALCLGCAAAGELAAGRAGSGRVLAARFATPTVALLESGVEQTRRLEPAAVPAGTLLRARLDFLGGGPAASVRLALRREEGAGSATAARVLVSAPRWVDLALPAGRGPLVLALERIDGEAIVALAPDGLDLLTPAASERVAASRLAARAALALVAALSLALGFGAWVSAPTAFLGALAVLVVALLSDAELARASPWSALRFALELAGRGVAAPWPSARAWIVGLSTMAAGLGLAVAGLRTWRRAP